MSKFCKQATKLISLSEKTPFSPRKTCFVQLLPLKCTLTIPFVMSFMFAFLALVNCKKWRQAQIAPCKNPERKLGITLLSKVYSPKLCQTQFEILSFWWWSRLWRFFVVQLLNMNKAWSFLLKFFFCFIVCWWLWGSARERGNRRASEWGEGQLCYSIEGGNPEKLSPKSTSFD